MESNWQSVRIKVLPHFHVLIVFVQTALAYWVYNSILIEQTIKLKLFKEWSLPIF
jgi:hypothetical protein